MQPLRETFAYWCRRIRLDRGITQQELADAVGIKRGYVATLETGRANPSLEVVSRIADALAMEIDFVIRPPIVVRGHGLRDAVHARCSGYTDRRFRDAGFETAREVEIVHARSHGWIDLLAFDPGSRTLVIVEIKTILDDLGALERQVGWYERSAFDAARRLGWQPARTITWLVMLASAEAEAVLRSNRVIFAQAFPIRARAAMVWMADRAKPPPWGRVLALIDPASRRRDWLIRTRLDGRRSDAPYRDYADAAARLTLT
jgi:transcriptional regulator with XRE-family HTH domain